jgi:CCR4-NOT transcription complex subunit 3
MEKFKAVEKEMKTKAFSKEGLNAAAKLDPKEKEKMEVANFLGEMVDELGRQIESQEAEVEAIQATLKKGKKDSGKADRMAELERTVERHKWHTGKLEILLRSLENGSVEVEQVKEIDDGIRYYVEQNQEVDFMEDDTIYDDLNLEDEEDQFGIVNENDKVSSQDNQSIQDEPPDHEPTRTTAPPVKTKSSSISENTSGARRPSVQMKSPLPALSTLHASLPGNVNGKPAETMRPAPLPTIPTGQPLKYASAAAAAASSVGIAPLPPPPAVTKTNSTASPAPTPAQPVAAASPAPSVAPQLAKAAEAPAKQPTPAPKEEVKAPTPKAPTPVEQVSSQASKASSVKPSPQVAQAQPQPTQPAESSSKARQPPSPDSGIAGIALSHRDSAQDEEEEESIYHLPSSLTDLLGSFEETRQRAKSDKPFDLNMMNASRVTCPTPLDAEKPNHYKPQNPYAYTPAHYPQEPLGIFDDPRLYSRIDTDSLFYAFYYRQGTYQQYLAAKALKSQSWRFHKQYQTWFQRHEEPKNITEEFEQGTYRFFDYESTW